MDTIDAMRLPAWRSAPQQLIIDLLLAAALAGTVVKVMMGDTGEVSAERGVLVAAIAFGAVLLRRRWPVIALGVATAATVGAVVAGVSNPGLVVVLGVLTFSIAMHSERRVGLICALSASSVVYLSVLAIRPDAWSKAEVVGIFAWIFMAAAIGDAARTQKAYVAEVEERARRAEHSREEEARRRVADERMRIARELHDVVAHHIAVISVQAGAATHVLERHPEQVGPALAHIRAASETVLAEMKSVVGVLRSAEDRDSTEPAPGLARLPELLGGLQNAGFPVQVRRRGVHRGLPALVDLAAYRIVQEALTNAHRYGDGAASLLVEYAPSGVILEVVNRIGPRRASSSSGFGLLGMRERAAAAGGTVSTDLDPEGRFRLHAVLPAEDDTPVVEAAARQGHACVRRSVREA